MKNLSIIILMLCGTFGFAQDTKLSVTLGYPISLGDNTYNRNFNDIVDLGVQYRFAALKDVQVGTSLNFNYLRWPVADNETQNNYLVQPRVFGELLLKNFRPQLGIGYSFNSTVESSELGSDGDKITSNGINISVGASYDVLKSLFVHASYNYTRLSFDGETNDFFSNVNQLQIGLGYRF